MRVDGVRGFDRFRQHREHRPHAPGPGHGALQAAGGMRDGRQRTVHRAQIGDDHRELADRHLAAEHVLAADNQDERRSQDRDRADHDREHRFLPRDGDPRFPHLVAEGDVAPGLVRLAREALDQANGREDFVQPLNKLRLELLHSLGAHHERRHVVAQAQEEKRHDRQREHRHRHVEPEQDGEHHDERRRRRDEREQAAHHQVLDGVRVHVDAIHGIARAARDVVMQAERLEVLEEPRAQVVHHPLTRADLHLHGPGGDELVHHLQQDTSRDDDDERAEQAAAGQRLHPRRQRLGEGVLGAVQDVVDDELEGPGLQRAEHDLHDEQDREDGGTPPVGTQERQHPRQQRPGVVLPKRRLAHRVTAGGVVRGVRATAGAGASVGARREIFSTTS